MRILIIEDEPKTAAYLKKGLTEESFVVDTIDNGEDGLYLATTGHYDLLIIDVMLPGQNGWSVIQKLRKSNETVPALFVTARDSIQDRVKGLELGGDDYLVKPFAFSELLARVRALLRRGAVKQSEQCHIADLEIDFLRHKALRNKKRLDLTPKEFALLSLLARRSGEVISRTRIAEQVWDMNFDSETNIIDVAVRRMRRKVDDPFERKLVHTVRGVGYVLEER